MERLRILKSIRALRILSSIRIINLSKYLQEKKEFIMSKQIVRSGTSIGANIREAKFAQSDLDFIHKMSIALKESKYQSLHFDQKIWLHWLGLKQKKKLHASHLI